jgi:peptidoglycan/LPS O-acetylase OafA/YrhL
MTIEGARDRPDRRQRLEAGRAVAALALGAHRAGQVSDAFPIETCPEFVHYSLLGVKFFFLPTGFIIYNIHHENNSSNRTLVRFINRRFWRIYFPLAEAA